MTRSTRYHLSDEDRLHLITLFQKVQNVSRVAEALKISRDTVYFWLKRYRDSGCISRKRHAGPRLLLTEEARAAACEALLSKRCSTTQQAAKEIYERGLTPRVPSKQTISRALSLHAESGGPKLVPRRGPPRRQLTARDMQRRLKFALANKHTNWGRVLFTDRKKFSFQYPGVAISRSEWVEKGQQREAPRADNARGVNLYAGICRFGVTDAHLVAGTCGQKSQYLTKGGKPAKSITTSTVM